MNKRADVVLIGTGIMSATLGIMIKELYPSKTIRVIERLDKISAESSDAMNNAGTGHSAFCELNYTPELPDGSIDISKAVKIAEQFESSRQFWSHLIDKNIIDNSFIESVPHMSFVWGDDIKYLKKRYDALIKHPLFSDMDYTEDRSTIESWSPLIMEGRGDEKVAATKMKFGTDVDFGHLAKEMLSYLSKQPGVTISLEQEVIDLYKRKENWIVDIKTLKCEEDYRIVTPFIFIGAGGGTLPLLQKSGIKEARGFGGFPVSGQWLLCKNQDIINKHNVKVYGKASVGSPPMSVPHLDTRIINGKKELLFGPYAGFSTKFLKEGSNSDLFKSVKTNNILPLLQAGIHNLSLTKYLIDQVTQSQDDRIDLLKKYFPNVDSNDWELGQAGQRVQVIKRTEHGGVLEFGTEMVISEDKSISALLGASPGASTAVSIMVSLIERCFGSSGIEKLIPTYKTTLTGDLIQSIREKTNKTLDLIS